MRIGSSEHTFAASIEEVDREIDELRRSINTTRAHGISYYLLLVTIIFVGFALGYATHSLVGAAIILVGLAIVARREVTGYRERTFVLAQLLSEKLVEKRELEARKRELEIQR